MKNKTSLIYIFLLLQPILDLFTSLMVRCTNLPLTIGMITRGLFLLFVLVLFLKSKSIHKKKSIIYCIFLFIFCIIYFITKKDIFTISFLKQEVIYMFKYMYFPIVTICLINIYDELNLEKEKIFKILTINAITYSLLIIIPEITGTSFASYIGDNKGTVGWFFAANEIGAIMVALFPYVYYLLFERTPVFKTSLIFILVIFAMILLGTKTSFIGMIITEGLYFIYNLFNYKKNRGYAVILSIIVIILSFGIIPKIPAVKNLQNAISNSSQIKEETTNNNTDNNTIKNEDIKQIITVVFSGRDTFLFNTLDIYDKANTIDKTLGIGFVNRESINDEKIEKLIEIDPLDVFFHYGIIGFILYFGPLAYIAYRTIKSIFKAKFKLSFFKLTNIYVIGIITLISMIAGHVYSSPSVSIYVSLSIAMLDSALTKGEKLVNEKQKNKVTILALHLGYGGVEQYISSLCKMLDNNYEIEIISTYKVLDKPAFVFGDRVKITYLINDKPNKEEFKQALKDKNIINILKEGFKSIKLLYLKRVRNIYAIRNIYSEYIITTRSFHNKLVSYYAYDNIIKIATEHNYHNNDKKYFHSLINSIKGYDYLVVVSNSLKEFYKDKIGKTKCIYIPNVIDELPNKYTNLKNNSIINIGRIEKEKDQLSLIEAFKKVKEKVRDAKLYIIGDGSLKNVLEEKISEYDLSDSVFLTGFLSKKEIENYMINSKLFVLTSLTESFGLVLIEAMSYKIPCIAFDTSDGAKNLLSNGNGVLIKNRDIDKLSNEIISLLNDNTKLKKLSDKGYFSCKKYLLENVKEQWLELLKR